MPAQRPQASPHFRVDAGFTRLGFARVSLPRMKREVVRYREGNDPDDTARLLPGPLMLGNCVLQRATIAQDNEFFSWMNSSHFGAAERRDVAVTLLDEHHQPVRVWRLRNAFPVALDWSVLDAQSGEVLIETLELAVESMTVDAP